MASSTIRPSKAKAYRAAARATDEELLRQYRDHREAAAFEELIHRYERELYSYLTRYVGDAAMAQDLFQSTFLQVHHKCHLFQDHPAKARAA